MFSFERKFWIWIEKNIFINSLLMVTILGGLIRLSLRGFVSGDAGVDLLNWYAEIQSGGGLKSLGHQVGNYNMLYQFLIAIMTYIPIQPLYAYKALSCVFDYLLAGAVGYLVYKLVEEDKRWKGLLAYGMVILSPIVFLNSAVWAQCDSIYVFWIILSLIFLLQEKYIPTFLCYGIAIAFKLQAVFFLPVLLFLYFILKKFPALYFAFIPIMLCISGIPGMIMGRNLMDIFTVYLGQADTHPKMSMNYPGFWVILNDAAMEETYSTYKTAALLLTILVLAAWMIFFTVKKTEMSKENIVYISFILVYSCVFFLPAMHERYGYLYEILAIIIIFLYKETAPLLLSLLLISLFTYGFYLHGRTIDLSVLAVVNLVVYITYAIFLVKKMRRDSCE